LAFFDHEPIMHHSNHRSADIPVRSKPHPPRSASRPGSQRRTLSGSLPIISQLPCPNVLPLLGERAVRGDRDVRIAKPMPRKLPTAQKPRCSLSFTACNSPVFSSSPVCYEYPNHVSASP
jgi:hypothetical protein